MISKETKTYITFCVSGFFFGFLLALAFIAAQIYFSGDEFNWEGLSSFAHLYDVSLFASIIFPLSSTIMAFLYGHLVSKGRLLTHERSRLTSLINSLRDGIVVVNEKGDVKESNESFRIQFGDLKNISSIYPKEFWSKTNTIREMAHTNDDNAKKVYSVSSAFLVTPDVMKQGHFYVLSFRDIQNIKDVELKLEYQRIRMEENAKMASLGEMAAGFAHEINNPLTVINGNMILVKKALSSYKEIPNVDSEKLNEYLGRITGAVARITSVINALRKLSRKRDENSEDEFTAESFIDDAIALCQLKITGKDIKLHISKEQAANFKLVGQQVLLGQVLVNLLGNAVDAIDGTPNAWIRVEFFDWKTYCEIKVTDSGPGISAELKEKIFTPLFTTKDVGHGTGLGLSISKNIAHFHRGNLRLDEKSLSTCFVLTLPRANSKNVPLEDPLLKKSA